MVNYAIPGDTDNFCPFVVTVYLKTECINEPEKVTFVTCYLSFSMKLLFGAIPL